MEKNHKSYLGKRILAGIIDYILVFGYMLILMYFFGTPDNEGGYSLDGLHAFSVFIFWAIMTIGVEQAFGATIGNYLNNIKPISLNGDIEEKIHLSQSIKRHLLDIIDMSFFGLIGIVIINNTKNHQRLGDLWAKTVVIKGAKIKPA